MKISYDRKTFTFSEITFNEFRAIRQFMMIGQVMANDFKSNDENQKRQTELGSSLTQQIDDITIITINGF